MEILVTIGYIALCIVFFSIAIAIHEWGHFIVALKLGLKVERFSIGFGPAIWKKVVNGVEYRVSWIPFGGYVSIPDVDPEGTKKLEGGKSGEATSPSLQKERIPAWKELAVAFAGPFMNIVLAVVLAVGLSLVPSAQFGQRSTKVDCVLEGGAAEKAGIKAGDEIVKVGDRAVSTWSEMQTEVQITDGKTTPFTIRRDGAEIVLAVAPEQDAASGAYYIAAVSTNGPVASAFMPARNPIKQLAWDAGSIFRILGALTTPKEMKATGKALGGPVMIAQGIYVSVRKDFWGGLGFMRFLNVNLAILNLLPIPVLDGGLILFALIAIVFRRRVPDKIVNALSNGFMYLLLGLMAILVYRDLMRTYRMHEAAKEIQNDTSNTNAVPADR